MVVGAMSRVTGSVVEAAIVAALCISVPTWRSDSAADERGEEGRSASASAGFEDSDENPDFDEMMAPEPAAIKKTASTAHTTLR